MPVSLTPSAPPSLAVDPKTSKPSITNLFGTPQLSKMRSVVMRQGQGGVVKTSVERNGDPVDLSPYVGAAVAPIAEDGLPMGLLLAITYSAYTPPFVVEFWTRDSAGINDQAVAEMTTGIVVDPTNGVVQAPLTPAPGNTSGIYFAEIIVRETSSNLVLFSEAFYLVIERSLSGAVRGGPPTLAEVRLHLRDAPEGNRLLDEFEFDPAEIAAAINRCVDWFNEVEPPLDQVYNTNTFPYRYHWLEGIVAELFTTAAHYYRRNKFNYTAGGVQVSSVDKEGEYMQAADYHRKRWEDFARKVKVRMNMGAGFLSMGSAYDGNAWGA